MTTSIHSPILWTLLKLSPALAFIVLVSSSRASLFGTADYQRAAERLLSNQDFYGYIDFDERAFQGLMARRMQHRDLSVLVAGSSRTMQLDSSCFDGASYNASVSGAMISDIAAIVEQFRRGRHLKQVVIAADPWMLNRLAQAEVWEGARIAPNLERIHAAPDWIRVQLRLGLLPDFLDVLAATRAELDPLREIFDPASFQAGWKVKTEANSPQAGLFRKQPDGSLTLPDSSVNQPDASVTRGASNMADFHLGKLYMGFNEIDPFLARAFTAFAADLKASDIKVTLVLTPFHPAYYQRVTQQGGGKRLPEVEAYFKHLGYEVIGSYAPSRAGVSGSDFFDGVHMRKASLKHLYGCTP